LSEDGALELLELAFQLAVRMNLPDNPQERRQLPDLDFKQHPNTHLTQLYTQTLARIASCQIQLYYPDDEQHLKCADFVPEECRDTSGLFHIALVYTS
jgi:hypothetical protein